MGPKRKKGSKGKAKSEINDKKHDEASEKNYLTKKLETSIKLLESIEDEVVLDSLLFMSKYGDIQVNNLNYLQFLGLLPALLKLLDHNVCIQRLALRLIDLLLRQTDLAIYEIDQEKFDSDIVRIMDIYLTTDDNFLKEFSVKTLERLAITNRAHVLIYKADLLKPIQATVEGTENMQLLEYTLKLLCHLIDSPEVLAALIEPVNFNPLSYIEQMKKSEPMITYIVIAIFEKITHRCVDAIQKRLKEARLVEAMLDIVLDDTKIEHRINALNIINNCMNSEETNTYFVCTRQFLTFSQWVRTCDDDYIIISAEIFEKLCNIPSVRQMLYDLAIDETVLYFLRSELKVVLNKTCNCIRYLSTHKYSCAKMLTPVVAKRLFEILQRRDPEEDPENEVALRTVHELCMRDMTMIGLLHEYQGIAIILQYFNKALDSLALDSYLRVLEIINLYINSYFGHNIMNSELYQTILDHYQKYQQDVVSIRLVELMNYCLKQSDFRSILLINNVPRLTVAKLKETTDEYLMKFLCSFVFNALVYKKLTIAFIESHLIPVLRNKSPGAKERVPFIDRVILSAYNICLPLKFFETKKLELTDRIRNCFYIICGLWEAPFPFLELLEMQNVSTLRTIYVVHHITDQTLFSATTLEMSSLGSTKKSVSIEGEASIKTSSTRRTSVTMSSLDASLMSTIHINYGKLSVDPYLFFYLKTIYQKIIDVKDIEEKVKIVATFIDQQLSGPKEEMCPSERIHAHTLHIEMLKKKLGTNMIPIGYVRLGFHCERALLFKTIMDKLFIPTTLEKGASGLYWNEVALIVEEDPGNNGGKIKCYVVDLMKNVGSLYLKGTREANVYCGLK